MRAPSPAPSASTAATQAMPTEVPPVRSTSISIWTSRSGTTFPSRRRPRSPRRRRPRLPSRRKAWTWTSARRPPSPAVSTAPAPITLDLSGAETTGKLEPITADLPDLELPDEGLTFTTEPVPAPQLPAAAPAPAATADSGMIEFDLGALSLDLPEYRRARGRACQGGCCAGIGRYSRGRQHRRL